MFCAKCGNELPENALFCGKCGNKIEIPDNINMEKQQATVPAGQGLSEQQATVPAGQGLSEQQTTVQAEQKLSGQQQMPSYQSFAQQPNNQAEKRKIPLIKKVLVLEAVVLAVLAFVCYTKVNEYTSPETVAKEFFTAVMSGDEKRAFDLIDIDESEYVSEKYFKNVVNTIGKKNLSNFKVNDTKEPEKSNQNIKKRVEITYRLKEDTSDYSFFVELEKSSSKKLFLFDEWKVNIGNFIQKDVTLYVNEGSKVKLDGKELNEKYLSEEGEDRYLGFDQYVIPKMFYGTYEVFITHDVYMDYKMSMDVSEDGKSFYEGENGENGVAIKQEAVEKIAKQSQEDFQALWSGAVQQKSFNGLSGIQMIEDNYGIEEEYEELVDKFKKEDGAGLQNIDFKNFEVIAKVEDEEENDTSSPVVDVSFSAPFSCVILNRDWWTGELDSRDGAGDYRGTLSYMYYNGKWGLREMSISNFYY